MRDLKIQISRSRMDHETKETAGVARAAGDLRSAPRFVIHARSQNTNFAIAHGSRNERNGRRGASRWRSTKCTSVRDPCAIAKFVFRDRAWITKRKKRQAWREPLAIYEVHLGS